jgi:hypothetical protein
MHNHHLSPRGIWSLRMYRVKRTIGAGTRAENKLGGGRRTASDELPITVSSKTLCAGRLREQVAIFRDVLPDSLRAVAGHVLDVAGKPVVAIVAVQPHHGGDVVLHVRVEP